MFPILESLLPVFVLVLIGALFKKWQFPGTGFWQMADRLTYFVLLPALIVEKLATTEIVGEGLRPLIFTLMGVVLFIALFTVLIRKLLPVDASSFTSIFQGSIRPNTYVALAAAMALYGQKGLALTAVGMAGVIPLVNVLCILSFAYYVPGKKRTLWSLIRQVFNNPLVVACLLGITLNLTGIGLPFVSHEIFKIISSAALPLGLISVGTGLRIHKQMSQIAPLTVASILKLFALPLLAYLTFVSLGVEGLPMMVGVTFSAVPCAVSSYILAGHLNGNQELMASIITIETLLAFVTMPILLSLLF